MVYMGIHLNQIDVYIYYADNVSVCQNRYLPH